MDVPALIAVMASLAECLAHVHERGLIHGDFKPLNAMRCSNSASSSAAIARPSSAQSWRLIDFDAAAPIGHPVALKYSEAPRILPRRCDPPPRTDGLRALRHVLGRVAVGLHRL